LGEEGWAPTSWCWNTICWGRKDGPQLVGAETQSVGGGRMSPNYLVLKHNLLGRKDEPQLVGAEQIKPVGAHPSSPNTLGLIPLGEEGLPPLSSSKLSVLTNELCHIILCVAILMFEGLSRHRHRKSALPSGGAWVSPPGRCCHCIPIVQKAITKRAVVVKTRPPAPPPGHWTDPSFVSSSSDPRLNGFIEAWNGIRAVAATRCFLHLRTRTSFSQLHVRTFRWHVTVWSSSRDCALHPVDIFPTCTATSGQGCHKNNRVAG
jgi:hypothetical protein